MNSINSVIQLILNSITGILSFITFILSLPFILYDFFSTLPNEFNVLISGLVGFIFLVVVIKLIAIFRGATI